VVAYFWKERKMKFTITDVEAEVKRHPSIVASLNTATGEAHAFILPNSGLPSVDALESQRAQILGMIDRAGANERKKLKTRLEIVEADLRRARDFREAGRRSTERASERAQEQGMPVRAAVPQLTAATTTNDQLPLRDRIAATTRAVQATAASVRNAVGHHAKAATIGGRRAMTPEMWATFFADCERRVVEGAARAVPRTTRT
jgi:hypothetical protein